MQRHQLPDDFIGTVDKDQQALVHPALHHFTSLDHEKLGLDLCHTLHKALVKAPALPNSSAAEEV